jgi:hypothetical protein
MLVDSPYAGDWMASIYTSVGTRADYHLFLNCDGTFERIEKWAPGHERKDQGRWYHKEGDDVLRLESEPPAEDDWTRNAYRVLSVLTCEKSNCLMVLRWAGLGSRNLPILFYRVHLPGRWYSEQLGIVS